MLKKNSITSILCLLVCSLCCYSGAVTAASDSRLPDGSEFVFWEQPLTFSKTYYVDGNSPKSNDHGPGTQQRPFRTINKAAEVLQPGERVVIASGIYRECIRPARGGSGPDKMISYEAAPGAIVFVKGSEVLKEGWQTSPIPVSPFGPASNNVNDHVFIWKHELTGALFPDAYNPFALANVPGDWSTRIDFCRWQTTGTCRAISRINKPTDATPTQWLASTHSRWTDHARDWWRSRW